MCSVKLDFFDIACKMLVNPHLYTMCNEYKFRTVNAHVKSTLNCMPQICLDENTVKSFVSF